MENIDVNKNSIINQNVSIESINIYKNTSIPRDKKGCYQFLHTLEPTGIQFTNSTKINITVEGEDISGFADIYIHNTDNIKKLQAIRVAVKRTVNISVLGELFIDIDQVKYLPNNDIKFNFTINLEMDSNSYIINPIFDIRANKISQNVINDEVAFKQKVHSFENKEYGMIMISNNVRIYMPKSKYIPMYFSPIELLELYEKVIASYNNLAGFDIKSKNKLFQPRKQFVLISARNNHLEFASAGSTMMDTAPETSKFYFTDGWGLFHEFAHLFEGWWSIAEVWTNMYSKYISERTSDGFVWLWQSIWDIDRKNFEKNNIKILYEKYLINQEFSSVKLGTKIGLYFLLTLEELLGADFTTKTEKYARENPPLKGRIEYILYSIAKNYNVNIIPYAEIYNQYIENQNLTDEIIDLSKSSPIFIPKNSAFDSHRYISTPVTIKRIYVKNKFINGISNVNSIIKIKIKNNIYNIRTDKNGKFKFTIPTNLNINLNDSIFITSKELGKSESIPKMFYLSNGLSDNTITFMGINNIIVAKINFDIQNKQFLITSTGKKPNIAIKNIAYFTLILTNSTGDIKFRATIKSDESADNFKAAVELQNFEYNDVLELISITVKNISITNYNNQKLYYNIKKRESFKITEDGLINPN